jgi:hypothetical protein
VPNRAWDNAVTRRRSLGVLLALTVLAFAGTIWAAVLPGGPGNDVLRGTSGADKLYGRGGNDRLLGRAGNDLLVGGPGKDVLTGGRGTDRLTCGPGRDMANADRKDKVASSSQDGAQFEQLLPPRHASVPTTAPVSGRAIGAPQRSLRAQRPTPASCGRWPRGSPHVRLRVPTISRPSMLSSTVSPASTSEPALWSS